MGLVEPPLVMLTRVGVIDDSVAQPEELPGDLDGHLAIQGDVDDTPCFVWILAHVEMLPANKLKEPGIAPRPSENFSCESG